MKVFNWKTPSWLNEIQLIINFLFTQLFTLWSWLPVRITMYQPVLLYTTEEHGCSLTTFFIRVEQHEPTLLMIKTCNNEVNIIWAFVTIYSSLISTCSRYLEHIVHQDGVKEILKMTAVIDKHISVQVKLSSSHCILNEQSSLGWELTVTRTLIMHPSYSWQQTIKW